MRRPHGDGRVRIAYFPTSPRIKSMRRVHGRLPQARPDAQGRAAHQRPGHQGEAHAQRRRAGPEGAGRHPVRPGASSATATTPSRRWAWASPSSQGCRTTRSADAMLDRWGSLPWYDATEDTIYDALVRMVESADLRAEYAALGMAHVRRWHDAPVVVGMLSEVYRTAPPTSGSVANVTTPRAWAERRSSPCVSASWPLRAEREKRRRVA